MSSYVDNNDKVEGESVTPAEASDAELIDEEKEETFFDQVMELIYTVGTGNGYDDSDDDGTAENATNQEDLDLVEDGMRYNPGSSNVFLPFDPMVPGNFPGHEYCHANMAAGSSNRDSDSTEGTNKKKSKKFSPFRKSFGRKSKNKSSTEDAAATTSESAGKAEEADSDEDAPLPTENYVSRIPASLFNTRKGPNYNRNKEKAPSAPALMELMSVDYVRTPRRVKEIGTKLNIPPEWTEGVDSHIPGVPPLFIINAQVPYNWPTSMFTEVTDGPCYAVYIIFRLTKETTEAMKNLDTAAPAVKLFARYCSEAPELFAKEAAEAADGNSANKSSSRFSLASLSGKQTSSNPWNGRAKLCIRCENLDELGLPGFLQQYNAKPVLIRESGVLLRGSNYVEMSVNIRKFGMLANNTLPMVHSRTNAMVLSVGFCIEAREEEEMPEGLFGCCQSYKLQSDPKKVPFWFARRKESK